MLKTMESFTLVPIFAVLMVRKKKMDPSVEASPPSLAL